MHFAFDPEKLASNVAKHQTWFALADDFEWETATLEVDTRKHYGETRFIGTGYIGLRLYVLIFTLRESALRIISLRKANPREMERYAKT